MAPPGFLKILFDVRSNERRIAALMCSYFFLVITSFWILKPIKKTLFINHYAQTGFDLLGREFSAPEAELLAKVLNMLVAAVAAAVFGLLATRLRRQQLTYVFSAFFIVSYGLFAIALDQPSAIAVWSFYLFGDLFSTLMVATFFAFLNDSVDSDAAKRLYGLVGFGGVAGGVFGSSAVALWIDTQPIGVWLLITALLAGVIVWLARAASRALPGYARAEADRGRSRTGAPPESRGGAALEGARLVFGSRYLLAIVAIVGIYELVSTMVDFQFTSAIIEYSKDAASRDRNFATVYATTNWLSMFVQLFLTSLVMRKLGMAAALIVLPGAIALSSMGFLIAPSLMFGGLLSVSDNGFSYSLNQSAKEALYVPTTQQEKYQAKAFIDMFVQRFAKALGVGVSLLSTSYLSNVEGVRLLSFAVLPLLAVWGFAAFDAGRQFNARSGSSRVEG